MTLVIAAAVDVVAGYSTVRFQGERSLLGNGSNASVVSNAINR